jgi:hypothetical protein
VTVVCATCSHAEREAIDRALAAGNPSLRQLAARYGISTSALHRHRSKHLPGALVEVAPAEGADSALARLEVLIPRVEKTLRRAERDGKATQVVTAARELRQCLELVARLRGELRPDPAVQVNVLTSADWVGLRGVILTALDPHPAARIAIADAIVELESGSCRG